MASESSAAGVKGAPMSPVLVLVLTIVTCGIYGIIWMFTKAAEMGAYLGQEVVSTSLLVVGICCAPLNIYNIYLMAKALPQMQERAGLPTKDDTTLILILAIFVFPVAVMVVQTEMNKVWETA